MANMWMVRAGRESAYVDDFLQHSMVSIGWPELGPLEPVTPKNEVLKRYRAALPKESDGKVNNGVGQIVRFLSEIKPGDQVVTYDRNKRTYYLGEILSDAQWSEDPVEDLPRIRKVKWARRVARDRLSAEAKNTLGAIQTLFRINNKVASELESKAVPIDASEAAEEIESADDQETIVLEEHIRAELIEKSEETIEDRIARLDWEEMQNLVAGILRGMGYRTKVSSPGPDRGYDVFASPDGLGLQEPRIFVEVKHRPNQTMGSQDIRSFLGGRSAGDRCLYVSTGGFTKDARYEAERASVPLHLIGLVDLRKLLLEYYEDLDEETRNLIPLKRIYVPAD